MNVSDETVETEALDRRHPPRKVRSFSRVIPWYGQGGADGDALYGRAGMP